MRSGKKEKSVDNVKRNIYRMKRIEKELRITRETSLDIDGVKVDFVEYEDAPEGDFVSIRTDDHGSGVRAEYTWFAAKYPGALRVMQQLTGIKLNGVEVRCDILTIELPGGGTRNIYFDISQIWADLQAKILAEETIPIRDNSR